MPVRPLGAVRRLLVVAIGIPAVAVGAAGCGGTTAVAHVGDRAIGRGEVDRLLEHAREEARNEHRAFPEAGSAAYRALQREALAILVSRARVEVAARRLGIDVTQEEVARALGQKPPRHREAVERAYEAARQWIGLPEQDAGEETAALRDAVRTQLTLEKVVQRVGAARIRAWLDRTREVGVGYADGWAP